MCRQQGDCSLSILEDNRGCVGSRETVLYPYWRSIEDVKAVGRLSSVPIGGQQRMCRQQGDCPLSLLEDNRGFVGSKETVLCLYWRTIEDLQAVGRLSSVPIGGHQMMCWQLENCPLSLLEDNRGCVGSRETVLSPYWRTIEDVQAVGRLSSVPICLLMISPSQGGNFGNQYRGWIRGTGY